MCNVHMAGCVTVD